MAPAADRELLGRERELLRLDEFLTALPAGGRAVTLSGEPGIGKTTVWRAAVESEGQSRALLSARCVEAELPLALVGLSDLVGDVFGEVAGELEDHDRAALAAALGVAAPDTSTAAKLAVPRAFLALLRLLAGDGPVLIAIDDVQWLDPSSARILGFAARRLDELPVGILVTQRAESVDPLDLRTALEPDRHEELHLGPLSLGALAHLVRTHSGAALPRPVLARVHEASGGNPMFALEFARAVERDRPQLGPIAIPTSLRELVRTRVEGWPDDVRRLLAIVAATERPTPALLEAVDPGAREILASAEDLDAVAMGDEGVVRFTHPLLGSAAYGSLTATARRSLHAELAEACDDAEERTRHLALAAAGPDRIVAELLDEAAVAAAARGAPDAAAELAQEAVRLTPLEDASARHERELAIAVYLGGVGRPSEAAAWLARVLDSTVVGPQRARALLLRVGIVDFDVDDSMPPLAEALEHVGDDVALRASVLLHLSSGYLYRDDLAASEQFAREAFAAAEEADDPALLATSLAVLASRASLARHPEPELWQRAMTIADDDGVLMPRPTVRIVLGETLVREGELGDARELLEAELERARRAGIEPVRYRMLRELFEVEWRAGNWQLAERHLEDAWGLALDDPGNLWPQSELGPSRARLAALRGRVDEARQLVAEGIARAEAIHWRHLVERNRWVLGFLELSRGEPLLAWEALQDVARTPTWGRQEVLEATTDAVEALVTLGRLEDAAELLAILDEEVRHGHRWAAPARRRCSALVLIARGDALGATAAADEAAVGFDEWGFPLDRGRALLIAGEALRRQGARRRAAEKLEEAGAIFGGLGAALWLTRAETELRRARPRPRRDRGLTSAERRVAELVAAGKRNREVAAQLFTTVSTVEAHLSRIYRKLDIQSRTELARLVADGTLSLSER